MMAAKLLSVLVAGLLAAACTGGAKKAAETAPAPKPSGLPPAFPQGQQQQPNNNINPPPQKPAPTPGPQEQQSPNAVGPAPGAAPVNPDDEVKPPPGNNPSTPPSPPPGVAPSPAPVPAPQAPQASQASVPTTMGDWTNVNADAADGAPAVRVVLHTQGGRFLPFVALSHKDQVADFRFTYGAERVKQQGDLQSNGVFATTGDVSIPVKIEFNFKGRKCTVTIDAKPVETTKNPDC